MEKFEYSNKRYSKVPLLSIDKPSRKIKLSTPNEYLEVTFSKETNGGQFTILFNALSALMPDADAVAFMMQDMVQKLDGAKLLVECKQGVIWDNAREGKFREDAWKDEMSFEEWCSTEQIAREFYLRKNKKTKILEDKIINIADLLKK